MFKQRVKNTFSHVLSGAPYKRTQWYFIINAYSSTHKCKEYDLTFGQHSVWHILLIYSIFCVSLLQVYIENTFGKCGNNRKILFYTPVLQLTI